ncbi:MAG TPA: zeta toxin family protein [Prolixibacteraceae bacterium]|nr:zeta toxin family protein [Prolixibacteraceae bacterium]
MPNLYVISGCNGAGKTTASYTVLPEMLQCNEFVNVDEIAKGLSPFNPDRAAIEAGRLMLNKMNKLVDKKHDFAFETTLSPRSYVNMVSMAKEAGYHVTLLYFWLNTVELAIERVKSRVHEGGHDVAVPVIKRRYSAGLVNLFERYIPISDFWMIFDNSGIRASLVAEGHFNNSRKIKNNTIFEQILKTYAGANKGKRD